jgi:ATP-dependent Clp protease ATP-binding subunit ClpC
MESIVTLELRNLAERLKDRDLIFEFEDSAKSFLIEKGYDEKYGARPLRRAVERYVEDSLAEAILGGDIKPGEVIQVAVNESKDGLKFTQGHAVG